MTDAVTMDDGLAETAAGADQPDGPAPSGPRGMRARIIQVLKYVVTAVVLAAVVVALVQNWDKASGAWENLTWTAVLFAALAVLVGLVGSSAAWQDAVQDIGSPVTLPAALRVFMIGQLAKYIPGTVWVYLLQTELGRRAGVPRARAFLGSMTAMVVGIAAALIAGVAGLYPVITASDAQQRYTETVRMGIYLAVALLPVVLICLIPRVLTLIVSTALRLMRKPALDAPLTWGGVLRMLGWSLVTWISYGISLWLLIGSNADSGFSNLMWCIGACAIAVSLGMFFPTPSGVGGREAVLAALIAPILTGDDAFGVAIGIAFVSRAIFTVAEVIGAGLAALTDLRGVRRRTASQGS